MFNELIAAAIFQVLLIGVVIGAALCGLVWLIVYLCHHITIGWIP